MTEPETEIVSGTVWDEQAGREWDWTAHVEVTRESFSDSVPSPFGIGDCSMPGSEITDIEVGEIETDAPERFSDEIRRKAKEMIE
ncbi:MAG: hypothetical protein ACREIC_06460 [Limisphaerales bacterium]